MGEWAFLLVFFFLLSLRPRMIAQGISHELWPLTFSSSLILTAMGITFATEVMSYKIGMV